jgi:2-polyprenyl-3-methyl-5-hydroxy-6-metoxy-1,4-benzoquinol methylase
MNKLHLDKPLYFEIQYLNSKHSIIPFLKNHFSPSKDKNVLEIGSAEGGVLKAFSDLGCNCLGIELNKKRVELANDFLNHEIESGKISFISEDIYNINPASLPNKFNLIILKDVIEHIHHQEKFIKKLEKFLTDDGIIFFGFPSWRMPFGGHQQISKSRLLAKMPYYHLFPKPIYKMILKVFGESNDIIEDLLEIKATGISTKRFEKICKENKYKIAKQIKYLVAPIYEYKFGYKTKVLPSWIGSIPFFNDFFTFQSYYIVKK